MTATISLAYGMCAVSASTLTCMLGPLPVAVSRDVQVQLQLLTATVKLFLKKPTDNVQRMIQLVLSCATNETDNPDLRDRAYVYWRLLSTDPEVNLHSQHCTPRGSVVHAAAIRMNARQARQHQATSAPGHWRAWACGIVCRLMLPSYRVQHPDGQLLDMLAFTVTGRTWNLVEVVSTGPPLVPTTALPLGVQAEPASGTTRG
jgi:hypothetical protein